MVFDGKMFLDANKLFVFVVGVNLVVVDMAVGELMVPRVGFFSVSVITVVEPSVPIMSSCGEVGGEWGVGWGSGLVP